MKDFLLFIDTETSGLPKNWEKPYSVPGNWPHAVQVSWLVYTRNGELVKQEDYYINDNDFKISPSSLKIHGITQEFRMQNGFPRQQVMAFLAADLLQYQPMVIGHFLELDFHVTGVEFFRTELNNPIPTLPLFCTMQGTTHMVRNPQFKYLRLGQLFEELFQQPLTGQHNAFNDATATAACFFELQKRGEITDERISKQKEQLLKATSSARKAGWGMVAIILCLLSALIAYFL
ncbi:DNA polymerase III alpha subunit [Filimonas lacunae]|nr:DNA polymerase III alpha subunit [Filimonas lacunae]